jgi:hypothetical protein
MPGASAAGALPSHQGYVVVALAMVCAGVMGWHFVVTSGHRTVVVCVVPAVTAGRQSR